MKLSLKLFTFSLVFLMPAAPSFAQTATALVICESPAGEMKVKSKCTKKEKKLSNTRIREIFAKGPASGTTLTGLIGGRLDFDKGSTSAGPTLFQYSATLPAGQYGFRVDDVLFKESDLTAICGNNTCFDAQTSGQGSVCTGSTNNPTAPAGIVCLYLHTGSFTAAGLRNFSALTSNSNTGITVTFLASLSGVTNESAGIIFDWAYTVP